ncbi:MAG: nucleoside recognition domain-containing protein [Calditrichaceae bacterium]
MIFGFLSLQALVLMSMYFLGMFTAVIISVIIKKVKKRRVEHSLVMELPPYRVPMLSSLGWQVYERGKIFLMNAGTIILAISIVLWFLASFPHIDTANNMSPRQKLEQSYAGRIGHAIEPIIKPLGYDWKIGIGLITSFAAREVIISTLSTIYNLEEDEHHDISLIEAMRNDRHPDGTPVFSILVALSLMVFFAYAAQCMATFAIIKRETNSWKWPLLMVLYMSILAYSASLFVYQAGSFLGFA